MSPDAGPVIGGWSLFARLRVESHPLVSADNPPPFHWSLPGEPVGSRRLYLRRLHARLEVLGTGPDHKPNTDTGPMLEAIVSTAEPLSVFPKWCRQVCERHIIWL